MANLTFYYGTMAVGKTTKLLQDHYNYSKYLINIVVMKPKVDTKGSNTVVNRIGENIKVDVLIPKSANLLSKKYMSKFMYAEFILVDEAQFLSEKQVDELYYITKYYNIPVICYGLKTDFQSKLFTGSKRLLELSDELDELITICRCGKRAKFNARFINDKFTLKGDTNLIDGSVNNVKYIPLCGKCYLDEKRKYEEEK